MKDESSRVLRGGAWLNPPSSARVAFCYWRAPGFRFNDLGVRLVRMVGPIQQLAEVNNDQ